MLNARRRPSTTADAADNSSRRRHYDRGIYSNSTSSIVCTLKKRGPIMDTVLSFLISAGIIAFGVWVVAGTIIAGWPWAWPLMGLLAVIIGLLSLYGSVRDARTS